MTTNKSLSPSPPPDAPAAAPEAYVSHRFTGLRKIYAKSLTATLKANSYPNFASCFPTPATYCPKALEGVWKQLNTRLEEQCLKDFDKLCTERGLEQALVEWELLIDEAKSRKEEATSDEQRANSQPVPFHMLDAEQLRLAHVAPAMLKAETELQTKLELVKAQNQEVASEIEKQRSEMKDLLQQLERLVEDVESAATVLDQDPMHEDLKKGVVTHQSDTDTIMHG